MTDAQRALCVEEAKSHVWHIVSPQREYVPGEYAPIKCSKTEGIIFPWTERREPTCEECRGR